MHSEMDYENILRSPIRPLGNGSFGIVYLAYHIEMGIVAVKIIQKNKYDKQDREWESALQITNKKHQFPFILKYIRYDYFCSCNLITMEYANVKTLNIIAKQPHVPLPSYTLRALMKQILVGVSEIHNVKLIHRDIKCDNILLHSPPGSGRVYVKISDFGLAKKEDFSNEQTYLAGTIPYWV
ncbi:MAG: hypothetical protein EZS28_000738 [Streblomastix strix]|uniref:Protein kinase domain-containing protein n=1 Tax=Streblomastix strix TaxID=222440 RepID=A0A5J4XA07_9EUKA|nr:MAG: hypothetical protein EZS28_000738 [Streblomastix strix]